MSVDYDANVLPFADCELATDDVHVDLPVFKKTKKKPIKKKQQSNGKDNNSRNTISYIYFENSKEENNFLTFIPYTGPSNTMHLGRRLYLPQLISNIPNDSTISFQHFIRDYNRIITSLEDMSLAIYIRFGISYILRLDSMLDKSISLKDFSNLRNRGKEIKTAFYTCKGVSSPKHLLTTLIKHNYHQISSNIYSYEIQLYGTKTSPYPILHFQYNEQFQCQSIYYRPNYPINFDFIRNKTSSLFRTIDDSYSDIFDFRIQLTQEKSLLKNDLNVLDTLRNVHIDQVLFLDKSTHILHVSSKLQKFVRYLKCIRSSNYQNFDEQILISIGTYEEFQLNNQGKCELLMQASNTMTIEILDIKKNLSGEKLYNIGMWFSTLCQTCVDLPSTILTIDNKYSKWFSGIFKNKFNQSIKQINVNQLTTYKTQKSNQSYTNEELTFVKKILQEENLENILLNTNENKDIEKIYEDIKKRLKTSAVPSANEALKKVERAYRTICNKSVN